MYRLYKAALMAAAIALGLVCMPAHAVVVTFEELPHSLELQGVGEEVISKGYRFVYAPAPEEPFPTGLFTVGPSWQFNGRSAALTANSCDAKTTLTSAANVPFTLTAIDLAGLNGDKDVSVAFTGTRANGATVQKIFSLKGKKTWQRFNFPTSFRNLVSVVWYQGDCVENKPHMFDNLRLVPTRPPED